MVDVNEIRKDFPMFANDPDLIYLDNAATTFKPQSVIEAVMHVYTHMTSNIHRGDYDLSHKMSKAYDQTRSHVASFLNAEEDEIIFTSGASASLNIAAYGYGIKNLHKGDVILSTEAEHASGILPWFKVSEMSGAAIEYVPLSEKGELTVENFKKAMNENVKVVAIAYVSNVLGYINPIREITEIAHEYGAVVFLDAAQAVPHMKVDVKELDVDFMAFSGHKMLAPSGIGILYGKREVLKKTEPFMMGGGSNARFDMCGNLLMREIPYKFESGTPAIEATVGLDAAITYLEKVGMDEIRQREAELKRYAIERLSKLENVILYNPDAESGIITFNIKGVFAQDAAGYLNSKHIAVRTGLHCAKMLVDVLKTSDTIRASLYFYNTKEEIDRFVQACSEITLEKCVDIFF